MPCLLVLVVLAFPRIVLLLMFLLSDYRKHSMKTMAVSR